MEYPILDNLKSPEDVKSMNTKMLYRLAADIRNRINEVVRETGGHLGPNLGSVEIIVACHVVFNLDKDRLVFDVGHQAYPHKLITGRHKTFDTLRQKNGVSGYPNKKESDYDVFRGGHASTAISTATGILEGFLISEDKKDRKAIALIGDGSMTGGMAFEGLNQSGYLQKNLIVILNDNTESISPTVGALSLYFNKIRHNKAYGQLRDEVINMLKKIPKLGTKLEEASAILLDAAKHSVTPGQIFTDLGYDYVGVIDGHNIKELIENLEYAKSQKRPVLLHILTRKGKGYKTDRKAKEILGPHALSPGQRLKEEATAKNGNLVKNTKNMSYSECFVQNLIKLAEKNNKITAVTAAMAEGTALLKYSEKFQDRYYDVGICEQHAVGFCAGLASTGKRPVFVVYSTFLQRAFDQLYHEIILQGELPVMFCIDRAGLVGDDGPSHHGSFDIAYLRMFQNIIVMAPKDGKELGMMMKYGLDQNISTAIRYPRLSIPDEDTFNTYDPIRTGYPEVLFKGLRICIIAYGTMVSNALDAYKKLLNKGIEISLVNGRFAKPIHEESIIKLCEEHEYILTVEDGVLTGGYGSAIVEVISNHSLNNVSVIRLGHPDFLIEHASRNEQLEECDLDVDSIVTKVLEIDENLNNLERTG